MRTWVFTHGSLMNSPPFPVVASAVAEAPGWRRTFGHPSVRNWGTTAAPAPTCSLVHADGIAYGVAHLIESRIVEKIVAREAFRPTEIAINVEDRSEVALAWPMTSRWSGWTVDQLAEAARLNVAAGGGPMGDALDYVTAVAKALAIRDRSDRLASDYLAACVSALQRSTEKDEHP